MNALSQYLKLYEDYRESICAHSPSLLNDLRQQAFEYLSTARLPEKGDEKCPAVSVNDMFAPDYGVNINRVEFPVDTASTFRCGVPNVSTLMAIVSNDTFCPTSGLLRNLPDGVLMMSLAKAAAEMPELVGRYLDTLVRPGDTAARLNTLLLQDGVFVHISKGVVLEKPLQVVNIFNAVAPVMGVRRMLIVVDDDASATMLVCDHAERHDVKYLSDQVVEIFVGRNASLEFYDLEESSEQCSRLSTFYARQDEGSRLTVNGSTLMGGVTRNEYVVDVDGDNADTRLAGMAMGADTQLVDNVTDLRHHSMNSSSNQIFKYVLDGQSVGSFYGTIVVDEDAKFTNSSQTNRNILASADARMYTRPQLEIYCDDVKCSHGATVGQLDAAALFYMRSRGIPLDQARMMLMQAFMQDVVDTVTLPALKTRLQQLIEHRLSGRRTLCASASAQPCNEDGE